ncbi:MAG: hypothetical protein O2975_03105 [Proteobacteria bacterium]|nr:hypothetical protein [Pseudomonadota bacterium]
MRRNDFDVTDTIRTTDADAVRAELLRLFRDLYQDASQQSVSNVFEDVVRMYAGEHPDWQPCDTEYHDIQHVFDVTLAMARLMDGYERGRVNGAPHLDAEHFSVGLATALLHDHGYLRRRNDRRHRYGSEYTKNHVSRGSDFLRHYLREGALVQHAGAAAQIVHFTGYERPAHTIHLADPMMRRLGYILGTADIIAQMADRCYLEKCRDRLYPEFVLGGIAKKRQPDGTELVLFSSGNDLVQKTPGFYAGARKRLDEQLDGVYRYAERHFGGQNLYVEDMQKNIEYAQSLANDELDAHLRRDPPHTLRADVEPYPPLLIVRAPGAKSGEREPT